MDQTYEEQEQAKLDGLRALIDRLQEAGIERVSLDWYTKQEASDIIALAGELVGRLDPELFKMHGEYSVDIGSSMLEALDMAGEYDADVIALAEWQALLLMLSITTELLRRLYNQAHAPRPKDNAAYEDMLRRVLGDDDGRSLN